MRNIELKGVSAGESQEGHGVQELNVVLEAVQLLLDPHGEPQRRFNSFAQFFYFEIFGNMRLKIREKELNVIYRMASPIHNGTLKMFVTARMNELSMFHFMKFYYFQLGFLYKKRLTDICSLKQ